MPCVTYKTGFIGADGREEEPSEYLCDWPGRSNIAVHIVGCVKEIALSIALCEEHAATIKAAAVPLRFAKSSLRYVRHVLLLRGVLSARI
jgi:hypothetical protein